MLDHLRKQVTEALAQTTQVTLATHGIAGLQTSILACEASGLILYVQAPQTSEHLVNIEENSQCVVVSEEWELRGSARRTDSPGVSQIALAQTPNAKWCALIEIHPTRLQIKQKDGVGYAATIDID